MPQQFRSYDMRLDENRKPEGIESAAYIEATNTTIKAATPCSPRLLSKVIKLFVICEPKKATLGPNIISAMTETPNKRTPSSRNLFK